MQAVDVKAELSENDWIESEALRSLTSPPMLMTWFSSGMMIAMAIELYGHINTLLLGLWLLISLATILFRLHSKKVFNHYFIQAPLADQIRFVKRHQMAWTLNGFTWGIAGWLIFTNIPIESQYIGATVLTLIGLATVQNLHTHRSISSQFINLLMGTQVLGAIWYIAYIWQFQGPRLQYIHLLSLCVIWSVLHIFNTRMFNSFQRNLSLQFRNNNLIRSLNLKTEQLAHEKQVATNANDVIQRFCSSSAHDIRQPVYALKLYAQMGAADPSQLPSLLPKITDSCDSIHQLFDSLFEFEQINAGHVQVAQETVDIDEVIGDLDRQFKPLARRKNLEFRTNAISGYLQTDQCLIKRILTCFISNAIKYTDSGGILVAVRKKKAMVVFEVWDTGIGVDPVHLKHVFDEFYKVGEFSSRDEGFGLGLSVVKRLSAYAEGSRVSVNSHPGTGSVFRFELPIKTYTRHYTLSKLNNLQSLPSSIDYHHA